MSTMIVFVCALALALVGEEAFALAGAGLSSASALFWASVQWTRSRRAQLPLELAPRALVELGDAVDLYRFRVRLGRGRLMGDMSIRVSFCPEEGPVVQLSVESGPVANWLGPRTLLVCDREGRCRGPGHFEVEASARSGGRLWTATRRWPRDDVQEGRFSPAFSVVDGRFSRWLPDWEQLQT